MPAHLVGRDGSAHAGAADEERALGVAAPDRLGDLARLVRIVDPRLRLVGAQIDRLVPERRQLLQQPLAQLDAAMVEGNRDSHRTVTLPRMEGPELWRELGQQLRVDSIRAAAVTKSGHPTSSMSAADLMAVLLAKYLHYDFDEPGQPGERPPDLLEGPRLAAALLDVQGGGRDHRRGAAHLPRLRLPAAGPPDPGDPVGRRRHRLARPGPAVRGRNRRSPASSSTACPYRVWASAATARWPRARCGRPSSTRPSTGSTT